VQVSPKQPKIDKIRKISHINADLSLSETQETVSNNCREVHEPIIVGLRMNL
jgi:hypothetical protein